MPLQAITATEPIPGYRISERLGAGGYGEVWRADAPGGLAKAIKFVYGYLDEDRAARELKALNRIKTVRHPFLVSLERIEVVDGQLLIVTELAEASLKDRFDECRQQGEDGIPRAQLLKYMRDAADALDFMSQEHSLQHLDIKPENLLLLAGRVKVADFGLVKDIHDATASLMGGLTPLYAPPEVFDGRPSRRSDQYSLAIVYQEMLTGELPFPGTTAVQLARQHLNARPRLASLPEWDQPVIARALAKNPADRFESCGELVDALGQATVAQASATAPDGEDTREQRADKANAANGAFEVAAGGRGNFAETGGMPDHFASPSLPRVAADPAVVILPPVELESTPLVLQPTLFLGAGHSAGRVLADLKRRLEDQFGDLSQLPIFQTLLLDTNSKDLLESSRDQRGETLQSHEMMAMPLRRPQDYRNESRKLLKWLSRRWLYNVPKSLQTEGLRPLGRLALIDHASLLRKKICHALGVATNCRSIAQAADVTGLEVAAAKPRIVVVASISGGTGGGMVVDLGYLARHLLGELEFPDNEVSGFLLHSTGRDPQRRELEMVNAYATLSELNHFSRWGGSYPGEAALNVSRKDGDNEAFRHAYLVHLGDDLTDEQFEQQTSKVAEYLFLDSATVAKEFFQACRGTAPDSGQEEVAEIQIRTFGLERVSCLEEEVVHGTVEQLCRQAVDRWLLGRQFVPCEVSAGRTAATGDGSKRQTGHDRQEDGCQDVEQAEIQLAASLGFDIESLTEELFHFVEESLEATVDSFFREKLLEFIADAQAAGPLTSQSCVAHAKSFLDSWLGQDPAYQCSEQLSGIPSRHVEIAPLLDNFCEQAVTARVDAIRAKILSDVETDARVGGAQKLVKDFGQYCQLFLRQAMDAQQRSATEADQVAAQLASLGSPRSRAFSRRTHRHLHAGLMQYCQHRLLARIAEYVVQIVGRVKAQVAVLENEVLDLGRDLRHIAGHFAPATQDRVCPAKEKQEHETEGGGLQDAISQIVADRFHELEARFDERLEQEVLKPAGGLRELFVTGGASVHQLPARLRAVARSTVVSIIRHLDASSMLFQDGGHEQQDRGTLEAYIASANPQLINCGGANRLMIMLPVASAGYDSLNALTAQLTESPTIVGNDGGDFVLCREVEQMSLTQAAVSLIDDRRDLAESAGRLHTRTDVSWSHLPNIV